MSVETEAYKKWKEHCANVQKITADDIELTPSAIHDIVKRCKKEYNFFTSFIFPHYSKAKDGTITENADFHLEWANSVKADPNFFGVAEWPREHAKSVHNNIFIPLWLKINGELDGMVLGGKSQDDANRLLGDVQAELQFNQRYIKYFGEQFNQGSWEEGDFTTKDDVSFIALGRGQSPRGLRNGAKRPNLGNLDDLDDDEIVNNLDRVLKVIEWILGGFIGALDIRQSRFIMSGNRIHPEGILAHMVGDVKAGDPKREGLYHSKVFATTNGEPEGEPTWWQKFTKEVLHGRFKKIGTFMTLREYFHKYQVKGKRFKAEWIHWGKIPDLKTMEALVCYFDPSYKEKTSNDFKACVFWGKKGNKFYRIKCFVRQTTITSAVKWMYDLWEEYPDLIIDFYMEDVFLQDQFYEDFNTEGEERGNRFLPIRGDKRDKPDKFARIQATTPYYERAQVIWNEEERSSPDFVQSLDQILGFEKGSPIHDDAPDADEGAIYKLNRSTRSQTNQSTMGEREHENVW